MRNESEAQRYFVFVAFLASFLVFFGSLFVLTIGDRDPDEALRRGFEGVSQGAARGSGLPLQEAYLFRMAAPGRGLSAMSQAAASGMAGGVGG